MITKRSISKPDSKKEAWRNRDKANDDITSSHCSRPLSSSQTTTHPSNDPDTAHRPADRPKGTSGKPHATKSRVAVREPKSIPIPLPAGPQKNPRSQRSLPHQHAHAGPETIPGAWATRRTPDRRPQKKLRRKEVIQPHLPVRLPCYDLVPITSLTLDGSIHKGLGHRLRVLPTFMT